MTVPASAAGTVFEFDSAIACAIAELRPLLLLSSFLLGLLLCLRHVGSPIRDGLVRGPSIYTRQEFTSERTRKCARCEACMGMHAHHGAHHSSARMNLQCAASTGVIDSRLPRRRSTMPFNSRFACARSSSSVMVRAR